MNQIDNLLALLDKGQDNALLRFGLGNAYLQADDCTNACIHLQQATQQDPNYSAAWKLYGKALTLCNAQHEAIRAYQQGIRIAEENGDIQAAKEMSVFLKRLQK
ncbi:MAG: hypothetical protein HUJ30_09715 [Gammaproteobacteria bacterium]|nr:hypothetical protein [Gammaproteobacteria bacterium]